METQNLNSEPSLIQVDLPLMDKSGSYCPLVITKLSCGTGGFGISEDFIEDYQSLDANFIKNKHSTYFFKLVGDSMEPTLYSGWIAVVDRSKQNFHGKVCVVGWEDRLICKRVFFINESIVLKSDNPKYRDIHVHNSDNVILWGIVIAVAGFVE